MASSSNVAEEYVQFPCDLPQWERIVQTLTELRDNLCIDPSPWLLVKQLNFIHQLVQDPGASSSSQDKKAKKQKGFNTFTAGGVFKGLGTFLVKEISKDEVKRFFQTVFPCIVHHACAIGNRKPCEGLKFLLKQQAKTVCLSRSLVASIVACGFLCLFPGRHADRTSALSPTNFENFYCHLSQSTQCAKLKCILNYFSRISSFIDGPKGNITFTRKVLTDVNSLSLDDLRLSDTYMCPIYVSTVASIEDSGHQFLHVDFANRKIGGGVLGSGRVQEEIRFSVSPELLSSMLIFEALDDNEAILIEGFETFSAYAGYGRTLQYAGNLQDTAVKDANHNLDTSLCCIDALPKAAKRQYNTQLIIRELNKAYIGFKPIITHHLDNESQDQSQINQNKVTPELENFSIHLTSRIIQRAVEEAAELLSKERQKSIKKLYERPAVTRPKRRGSCQVSAGGLLPLDRLSVGHSSHSEGESGHSDTSDMEESICPEPEMYPSVPPYAADQQYPDRSWFMAMRRRSSNLSDISRRSSDAISRRSSRSSSTRWSSDFSSDFEEFYESFQKPRHAAIEEEIGNASLQEYVQNLVADSVTEGSSTAAQMMPGLQHFEDSINPPNVARPRARRPQERSPSISPIHLDYDSNQTDDEKIQDNIVTFAGNLVGEMLQGTTPPRDFSSSSSSGESVLNALGISAEDLLTRSRPTRSRTPRDSIPDDNLHLSSRRSDSSSGSSGSRTGSHDIYEPPAVSNVVNRLVGGAISEALSIQNLRRHAAEQGLISPFTLRHQGESLTDDIKEALASSSSRSYSDGSSPKGARASIPNTQYLHPRYSISSASAHHGPVSGNTHQHSSFHRSESFQNIEDFANYLARSIITDTKHHFMGQNVSASIKSKIHVPQYRFNKSHLKGRNDNVVHKKPEMQVVAEQLVMSTVQGAVEEVYGYKDVRVPFSDAPIPQRKRSASATVIIRRKGSTEEDLTDFVEDLNQRCSFGNLRTSRRHTTTGFRDQTLADFANELITSNPSSPSFRMFEEEVGRVNMEIPKLMLGESAFGRRGSNSSRTSSCDRSPRGKPRRSSFDLLLESFTKFSASIEKYIKFDIEKTSKSTDSIVTEPKSSREALYEFLAKCRPKDASSKKSVNSVSHLDWYVEDLLIDSFHDSFVYLYGENYSELIEKTRSEKSFTSQIVDVPDVKRSSLAVHHYVSQIVDGAFGQAFQVIRKEATAETQGVQKRESTSSSCYEDAFDIPYPHLEEYAQSMADDILYQVITEVTGLIVKDKQVVECRAIATGNWGCGAFGGDPQLKSLIQWIAASMSGAPLLNYYTFGDERMSQFEQVSRMITMDRWTVGKVISKILDYCEKRNRAKNPESLPQLFDEVFYS